MATALEVQPNVKLAKHRRSLVTTPAENWDSVERTMATLELTTMSLNNGNYNDLLLMNLTALTNSLPNHGPLVEQAYKVQLDRAFAVFRNASRDDRLSQHCRINLLALIEKRASNWQKSESLEQYYRNKIPTPEAEQPIRVDPFQGIHPTLSPVLSPTIPLLGPGEQIKSSGRFPQPTRIPGKNYFKDEIVINNADSGKVMGIKGRRVHMIEELSETIISFQRVTPGVKERLVQITGPNETRINEAIHLMGDTIRRNASPVAFRLDQPDLGSSSSVNSSASEESNRVQTGYPQSHHRIQHSFSTNDTSMEYKHTVTVGPHSIKLIGTNFQLVSESKLVLERFFSERNGGGQVDDLFMNDYVDDQFVAEEATKILPLEVKQSVVRQPLFPEAPKAAFEQVESSGRPADLSARNRRAFFGQTNTERDKVYHVKKYLRYSRDMIFALATSAISKEEPENWLVVCPAALIKVHSLNAYSYPQTPSPLTENFGDKCKIVKRTMSEPHTTFNEPSSSDDGRRRRSREFYQPNNASKASSSAKQTRRVSFDLQTCDLSREELPLNNASFLDRRSLSPAAELYQPIAAEEGVYSVRSTTPLRESAPPFIPNAGTLPTSTDQSLYPFEDENANLPLTTIPFRPQFKFNKKPSLPDVLPEGHDTVIPFLRSHSTPSPATDFLDPPDAPHEALKETKSFRPQLTNPKLGFLNPHSHP